MTFFNKIVVIFGVPSLNDFIHGAHAEKKGYLWRVLDVKCLIKGLCIVQNKPNHKASMIKNVHICTNIIKYIYYTQINGPSLALTICTKKRNENHSIWNEFFFFLI